jgi:hypothetical protein
MEMAFHVPEGKRIVSGPLASDFRYGNNGAFVFDSNLGQGRRLFTIASDGGPPGEWKKNGLDGEPWEHVSVHVKQGNKTRTPVWDEMCFVKDLFWDPEDVVIQIHPKKSEYVNFHQNTLHLWRALKTDFKSPPSICVGPK